MYLSNKELKNELDRSRDKPTEKLGEFFILLATNISNNFNYKYKKDKEDCIGFAILEMVKYYRKYDEKRSENAFAFISSIAYSGLKKGANVMFKYNNVEITFTELFKNLLLDQNNIE